MENSPGGALLQTERFKFFPATGGGCAPSSFISLVWSKLRPGDSSFFPYGLASPARADCIGVPRGRGWVRESGVAGCSNWQSYPPKGFSLRRGSAVGGGEV